MADGSQRSRVRARRCSRSLTARPGGSRSLSPRLTLFRHDLIVWRTFAFAIGVFVFLVITALVIGDQRAPHRTPTRTRGTTAWVLGKFQGTPEWLICRSRRAKLQLI